MSNLSINSVEQSVETCLYLENPNAVNDSFGPETGTMNENGGSTILNHVISNGCF